MGMGMGGQGMAQGQQGGMGVPAAAGAGQMFTPGLAGQQPAAAQAGGGGGYFAPAGQVPGVGASVGGGYAQQDVPQQQGYAGQPMVPGMQGLTDGFRGMGMGEKVSFSTWLEWMCDDGMRIRGEDDLRKRVWHSRYGEDVGGWREAIELPFVAKLRSVWEATWCLRCAGEQARAHRARVRAQYRVTEMRVAESIVIDDLPERDSASLSGG
jgi:hypothetical protein